MLWDVGLKMKPLQKEKSEISKKMADAQWDVKMKEKEIEKLKKEIEDAKELIEFYNAALK